MKRKSVAERAAELGLDQKELVQALKLLAVRQLKSDGYHGRSDRWRYGVRKHKPHFSIEKAAEILGVSVSDAQRQIHLSYPHRWTRAEILTAMFKFHKEHGRWPRVRDYKLANGLPSRNQWRWIAGSEGGWRVRSQDWWERQIARDRRCTPQMAFSLRNVLARKEALDRIGFETLIKKKLATVRDDDPEWGTLYELPGEMPKEPMVLLKVINSTAEPDGTFATYYLRVPPTIRKAREAVRWTFGGDETLGSQLYEPLVQT